MSALPIAFDGARALRLALGIVLFQGAWFACVIAAARGNGDWGIAAVGAAIGLLLAASDHRRADVLLIVTAVATGVLCDGALARWGVVDYASPWPAAGWAPAWILALWALWGAVLREPLRWLHRRPLAAALLGASGGALSYAAAAKLGAVRFDTPAVALAVLAIGWALIVPLQLAVARRLDQAAR